MSLLCEPNDAVRAVAVAKRREYPSKQIVETVQNTHKIFCSVLGLAGRPFGKKVDIETVGGRLMQVRPGDQPGSPKDTIESFVGHSSMGLLCPPASQNYRTG